MSVNSYQELADHAGHNLEVAFYGNDNVTIECTDCNEVLISFDKEEKT